MGAQLFLKAALPLAEGIATASDRCSKTGLKNPICYMLYIYQNLMQTFRKGLIDYRLGLVQAVARYLLSDNPLTGPKLIKFYFIVDIIA